MDLMDRLHDVHVANSQLFDFVAHFTIKQIAALTENTRNVQHLTKCIDEITSRMDILSDRVDILFDFIDLDKKSDATEITDISDDE